MTRTEEIRRHQLAARAWSAMRTLVLDRHDRRAEVAERLQMSFIRAKALLRLTGGALTMRELAAAIAIDAPYATVVVDDLERRGLVRRSPHPGDRRVKLVNLTRSGRRAAEIAQRILDEPPALLDRLSDAELAELSRLLGVLAADAGSAEL
ncbi:MAG TPA: MarR family transcriptional regulator [Jatrophihabitans sp.]|nr:MarR family transcriptional regulator [Jatrophihabitans sp.]